MAARAEKTEGMVEIGVDGRLDQAAIIVPSIRKRTIHQSSTAQMHHSGMRWPPARQLLRTSAPELR